MARLKHNIKGRPTSSNGKHRTKHPPTSGAGSKRPGKPGTKPGKRNEVIDPRSDDDEYGDMLFATDVKGKNGSKRLDDPGLTRDVSKLLEKLNQESQGSGGARESSIKRLSYSSATLKDVRRTEKLPVSQPMTVVRDNRRRKAKPPLRPVHQSEVTVPTNKPVKNHSMSVAPPHPSSEHPKSKSKSKSRNKFVVEPTPQWYTIAILTTPNPTPTPSADSLAKNSARAASLHEADIELFHQRHSSDGKSGSGPTSGDTSFLQRVLHEGTLSDRLGALTLLVQGSPVHNIRALETLRGLAARGRGAGGRGDALRALRCVVDWWVGGGAPPRKLRYFREQPLDDTVVTDQHLVLWHFEDWLKKFFFSILQILETLCLDPLPYVRTQALTFVFTLLRDKPEQEQNLLRLLVNKLGDTEKSISSRASYYLLQLLQVHPAMKAVVVREMTALILRPPAAASAASTGNTLSNTPAAGPSKHIRFTDDRDIDSTMTKSKSKPKSKAEPKDTRNAPTGNAHAWYYAAITFNQIVLTPRDREVALLLMDVYFEMFKEFLGVQGAGHDEEGGGKDEVEVDNDSNQKGREGNVDKRGRLMDKGKKGKNKGKGQVEVKGAAGFAEVEDAQSKLISAILTGINRAVPFAKIDSGDARLNKHIDTLFLITHRSTFNISLQALVLIQHISASLSSSPSAAVTSKTVTDRYYRALYASLHDHRLATSAKQAMYLNLFFKSVKSDPDASGKRTKALVRRFVQMLVSGGNGATEFVAGGLFLLGELFSTTPGLRDMLDLAGGKDGENINDEVYDPRKRDPQYAGASSSPMWELTILRRHYHPSIALYAQQLLSSQPLTANADLSLHTLSHFLDRFVYKNPKKIKKTGGEVSSSGKGKGTSAMQPAASTVDGTGVKLLKGEVGDVEAVHGERFLRRRVEDVPVDQAFFHRYFTRKREIEKVKTARVGRNKSGDEGEVEEEESDMDKREEGLGDDEADDSDEAEAEIWKAMKSTMPSVGEGEDLLEDGDDDLSTDLDDDGANEDLLEDSDDLIPDDDDVQDGLIEYDGQSEGEEEEEALEGIDDSDADGTGQKRKRVEDREGNLGSRRKKLKSLPTFASYEDYAAMIEGDG